MYDDGRLYDVPNDRLEQTPILAQDDTAETGAIRRKLTAVLKSMEE